MITTTLALVLIADASLFLLKRDVIESRVHATLPKINCGALATLEVLVATLLLLL